MLLGDDGESTLGCVGGRRDRVDRAHLDGQLDTADAGEVDRKAEQIGAVGKRRQRPGEGQREEELVRRLRLVVVFVEGHHRVLEGQHDAGIEFEGEVQVEGAAAPGLGVQFDFPGLAQRIRLDEMPLVVHVKTVVDGVILQFSDEARDIDNCHVRDATRTVSRDMNDDDLLGLLHETVDAIAAALSTHQDWGLVGGARDDEYKHDVVADAAALAVLTKAPVGVLSEESGITDFERDIIVVLDPVDGSTNASHGLPWFATSICAVDDAGPRAAIVINHVTKQRFAAVRGGGATLNGGPIRPTGATELSQSIVALSGLPANGHLGWKQFRALGASALDMCAVAAGMLDAFLDCTPSPAHGPWDYLGGLLICQEAGAVVADRYGEELVVLEHQARRTPVAAATPALLENCIKSLNKTE